MKGNSRPKMLGSMLAVSAVALLGMSHTHAAEFRAKEVLGNQHPGRRGKASKKKRGKR